MWISNIFKSIIQDLREKIQAELNKLDKVMSNYDYFNESFESSMRGSYEIHLDALVLQTKRRRHERKYANFYSLLKGNSGYVECVQKCKEMGSDYEAFLNEFTKIEKECTALQIKSDKLVEKAFGEGKKIDLYDLYWKEKE
jgi:stress response protein SCP2